jgi:hypothetical protein
MTQATGWEYERSEQGSGPDDRRSEPSSGRALTAVPTPARVVPAHEVDRDADRQMGLGRAILLGSSVGFLVVATIVCLIGLAAGYDTPDAIGIGAFAGLWGGPGFGGMMAATIAASRQD